MRTEIQTRKRYKFSKDIKQELNNLLHLDNYHACYAVIYDYIAIALAILLFCLNHYFYIISIFIIGSRQRALSTLLHEAGHSRLARNKNLNYFIGTFLSGYLIFWEFYTFAESHVKEHHNNLGDKERDPDYVYHLTSGLYTPRSRSDFILQYVITTLFVGAVFSYIKYIFVNRAPAIVKHRKQSVMMIGYICLIFLFAWYVNVLELFIILWVVPLFTVFPIIGWFIELSEHYPLVAENEIDLYMTRNRFSHFIEAFFFSIHAENFHLVHHLHPGIPFWSLSKAHQILLKDDTYKNLNKDMGGIFLSAGKQESFITSITRKNRDLFNCTTIVNEEKI